MAYATCDDGIQLYYESQGQGSPIVFVHEFGGSYWSWEPQICAFARRHQCITFAARGYPPSDVPEDVDAYSQARAAQDIFAVMDACELDSAHLVGLSMGGFAVLHAAMQQPDRVRSLVAAGTGYGAEKKHEEYFRGISENVAKGFESGVEEFAAHYAEGASRVQFQNKDPAGWRLFAERLARHSAIGAANTMRGVQAQRPSLYDLEDDLAKIAAPTLILSGDEDDHCLQPGIFLKRTIRTCGLAVLPKSGHTINLEEPELFNRLLFEFLASAEAGRWGERDPRADPNQIMRTK